MDNNEARFLLRAYRPGGADAADPFFAGALEQARRDPALRGWFDREQARDRAIAAKLKAVAPPSGLRESILTGARLSARRPAWWRRPGSLALAASLAVLLAVSAVWRYHQVRTDWSEVVARISDDAAHPERHGSKGPAADALVAWLQNGATHLAAPMAVDLGRLKADGCRTLSVAGHEVMEVCFSRNGGMYHLYVMRRPAASDLPGRLPEFAANGRIHSVMWTDAQHLYVLAGEQGEAELRALL